MPVLQLQQLPIDSSPLLPHNPYDMPRLLFALAALILASYLLRAQPISGAILGSAQDSTGAAVPGASVTIVNSETGLTGAATTNSTAERRCDIEPAV
jgi:hypothetical protein